jgi:hypothetical protein
MSGPAVFVPLLRNVLTIEKSKVLSRLPERAAPDTAYERISHGQENSAYLLEVARLTLAHDDFRELWIDWSPAGRLQRMKTAGKRVGT